MHIYLSKKIAIPNNIKLNCIAWHKIGGYVAVGGDKGLLKVLKLDAGGSSTENDPQNAGSGVARNRGISLPSNLSMNLTLDGHLESVQVAVWNESLDKLTTSDKNGIIVVWVLYKGLWCEEMINNRNKSTVKGMAWSSDGNKICIVYEDGAVIVGAANGNRIWGKELKGFELTGVQWSPDASKLLFSHGNGELHVFDNQGIFVMKIKLSSLIERDLKTDLSHTIVSLYWYDGKYGYICENALKLLVCYKYGGVLIMRDIYDDDPISFNVGMEIRFGVWNSNASIIAIGCERSDTEISGERNMVLFYDSYGTFLHTLKLPGCKMTSCAWEGGGLRLAMTIDSHIYFANVHRFYKWCYFKHTLVFANEVWSSNGIGISFWNIHSNLVNMIYVNKIYSISAYGNHCVIGAQIKNSTSLNSDIVIICDTSGTIIDEKYVDIEPLYITINSTFVIIASNFQFTLWQYNSLRLNRNVDNHHILYHVDDVLTGEESLLLRKSSTKMTVHSDLENNAITCITSSDKVLLIGRKSGQVNHYELPLVSLVNKYMLHNTPLSVIKINCNSSKAAVVSRGHLIVISLLSDPGLMRGETNSGSGGDRFERKDVWDICWAADNPHMLALMEKTRLYVFRGIHPEEPIACSGYLCSFQDLEIKTVLLDEVIANHERLSNEQIIDVEIKSLRDTRELLNKVGIQEAHQFIVDNSHPRLWRLLAEAALKQLDFVTAEVAYVYCKDLAGIEFINKIQKIKNKSLIKAEVAAFLKDFDTSEKLYLESDRKDLALALYKRLGNWFKVLQLMTSSMRNESLRSIDVYEGIGQYFADRCNWSNMKKYYEKAGNKSKLVYCYYHLENYNELTDIIPHVGRREPLLKTIGEMLTSAGLSAKAAKAYERFGQVDKAINLCIKHNEWDIALDLAKHHSISEMENILVKYVASLVKDNRLPHAIDVFQRANQFLLASSVASNYGRECAEKNMNITSIKKWFVFASLLHDEQFAHGNMYLNTQNVSAATQNMWRQAIAYHLYGVAHSQLYSGDIQRAFVTSVKVSEFADIISEKQIYCLLIVTSCAFQAFYMCSKAFVKLLSLKELSASEKEKYYKLSIQIFKKHLPKDSVVCSGFPKYCTDCKSTLNAWSVSCSGCNKYIPTCMITGESLIDPKYVWRCSCCKQSCDSRKIIQRKNCPLCGKPRGLKSSQST